MAQNSPESGLKNIRSHYVAHHGAAWVSENKALFCPCWSGQEWKRPFLLRALLWAAIMQLPHVPMLFVKCESNFCQGIVFSTLEYRIIGKTPVPCQFLKILTLCDKRMCQFLPQALRHSLNAKRWNSVGGSFLETQMSITLYALPWRQIRSQTASSFRDTASHSLGCQDGKRSGYSTCTIPPLLKDAMEHTSHKFVTLLYINYISMLYSTSWTSYNTQKMTNKNKKNIITEILGWVFILIIKTPHPTSKYLFGNLTPASC